MEMDSVEILEEIIAAVAVKRRKRRITAAAVEEITTIIAVDVDAEAETIMDSLEDLGGYSY